MEVRPGYKRTEVGVIPKDWEVKRLGEIAELTSSKRIYESDYVSSGIPFYRGQEITSLINGEPIGDPCFISEEKFNQIKTRFGVPHKGDILITAVGTLGNVYVVPDESEFYFKDGNLIWLRSVDNADSHFVAAQIRKEKSRVLGTAIGSSQKALTIVVLKGVPIALPPLPEQRAIAEALSDVDALIAALDRLIAKKRAIKQGAMQQLLTGQTRLPGFSGEWEVRPVKQFGEIVTGSTPSTAAKEFWNGSIPWVTPTDITDAKDIYSSERLITHRGLEAIRRLPANSVLVTCIASIGKNAVLKVDGACNQQINAIVPNAEHDADFLYYLIDSKKQYLLANAGITATSIISKRVFSELLFSIPPLPEQRAIATVLSDMDAEIAALEARREKTRALKQGMMQELLTGQIRLVEE